MTIHLTASKPHDIFETFGGSGDDRFIYADHDGPGTMTDVVAGIGTDDNMDLATLHTTVGIATSHATQSDANSVPDFSGSVNSNPSGPPTVPRDFNFDHVSDILLRNDSGAVGIWDMDNSNIVKSAVIATTSTDWKIAGTGDFNRADSDIGILLRNDGGAVGIWDMIDTTIVKTAVIGTVSADWKIAGTGDFYFSENTFPNADADILWRNDDGTVAIWAVVNNQIAQAAVVAKTSTDWKIAGIGDFNDNGNSDILLRNDSGAVAIWEMNGAQIVKAAVIATLPAGWKIVGTGDFNEDGNSDILLRNDSGAVGIWEMNDTEIVKAAVIATPSSDWKLAGTGNFSGDPYVSDILLRNDSGAVGIWDMNDTQITHAAVIGTIPADWHLIP